MAECQLTKKKGTTEFVSHHLVITTVIIISDKNQRVAENLIRNRIYAVSKYLPIKHSSVTKKE